MAVKKKVTKGMTDKAGYWFKNSTLITKLNITEEEQRELKTIIRKTEKYRRNNERKNTNRRNKEGLTPKQQEIVNRKKEIAKLRSKGKTQKEIAKELGVLLKTIKRSC